MILGAMLVLVRHEEESCHSTQNKENAGKNTNLSSSAGGGRLRAAALKARPWTVRYATDKRGRYSLIQGNRQTLVEHAADDNLV